MSAKRQKIAEALDALEADREALTAELNQLSDEQLSFSTHPDVWTIHQVYCHMALAEQLLLFHVAEKELQGNAKSPKGSRGLRDKVAFGFMRMFFAVGIPVKAPTKSVIPPVEPPPLSHLGPKWAEMRGVIRQWIEGMDDERLQAPIVRHPFAKMDVANALQFARWHFDRHRKQIQRLQKQPGFPT